MKRAAFFVLGTKFILEKQSLEKNRKRGRGASADRVDFFGPRPEAKRKPDEASRKQRPLPKLLQPLLHKLPTQQQFCLFFLQRSEAVRCSGERRRVSCEQVGVREGRFESFLLTFQGVQAFRQGFQFLSQQFELPLLFEAELAGFARGGPCVRGGSRAGGRSVGFFFCFLCRRGVLLPRLPQLSLTQPIRIRADVLMRHAVAFERNHAGHEVVQKGSVVADDEHCAGVIRDQFLQKFQRFRVQVVGRLVEHEHIRRPGEELRQKQSVALPAGQGFDRQAEAIRGKEKVLQIPGDMARDAAHRDHVVSFRHAAHDAFFRVQAFAQLIEVAYLQVGAEA